MKKKSWSGPELTKRDLVEKPPLQISRRQYYSQVQALFDPTGFLPPVLLQGKIILRKTWEDECKALGWDNPLPDDVKRKIIAFFLDLYELENLEFPRSLWPEAEVEGDPWLVIFSDGSIKGFGAVVYI